MIRPTEPTDYILGAVLDAIENLAIDEAYVAAAEEDSPNSPDFEDILDAMREVYTRKYTRELIERLQQTLDEEYDT